MRGFFLFACLSLTHWACVAQAQSSAFLEAASQLPECGLKCSLETITQSNCNINNSTCICTDPAVAAAQTACITQNCTVIESLQVANLTNISCGGKVGQSRSGRLIGTAGLGAVALVAIIVRLISRYKIEKCFRADDYVIIVTMIFLIPFTTLGVLAPVYGFGRNIWEIMPKDITKALQLFFWNELIYVAILGLCKLAMLLFYLRIFPSTTFRNIALAIMAWVVISTIIFEVLTVTQCIPVPYNWNGWKGDFPEPFKCRNINVLVYATAINNIAMDFAILLLPIPWLLRLKVGLRRKISVIMIFSLGIFICAVSIYRTVTLSNFKASTNPTWDYVDAEFWTAIEVYVSIIVPCLPAIRTVLAKSFKIFGIDTTAASKRRYEQSQAHLTFPSAGVSFKMVSVSTKNTYVDESETSEPDFFKNKDINLGDRMKGSVQTAVIAGRRRSVDVILEEQEAGFYDADKIESSRKSEISERTWYEDS